MSHATHSVRLTQMVTADGSQRLRQTVANYHINTDGMDEFFNKGTYCSTCRREEMSILKS